MAAKPQPASKAKPRKPPPGRTVGLTPQQRRFVEEYLIDMNQTAAAIRAGYSKRSAGEQGRQMLRLPHVVEALSQAVAARSQRTKIDADWLLTRLALEAQADMADLYADDGTLKPIQDWPLIWRQGLVGGVKATEERDDKGKLVGVVREVKLSDRVKRLEMIGKHIDVQAFRERVDHTSSDGSMSPPPPVYNITET